MVHRNWSDDHCNLSDTLTSILLLQLCKNKNNGYLERLTCTGPKCLHILYMYRLSKCKACSTNAHPHMHACMHVHMHAHTQAHAHIHLLPNTLFSSPSRTHMNAHTHTHTHMHTHCCFFVVVVAPVKQSNTTASTSDRLLIYFPVYADLNW